MGSTQLAPPHPHTISHTTKIDDDTPRTVQTCQWPLLENHILSIKYSSVYRPSTQTPHALSCGLILAEHALLVVCHHLNLLTVDLFAIGMAYHLRGQAHLLHCDVLDLHDILVHWRWHRA